MVRVKKFRAYRECRFLKGLCFRKPAELMREGVPVGQVWGVGIRAPEHLSDPLWIAETAPVGQVLDGGGSESGALDEPGVDRIDRPLGKEEGVAYEPRSSEADLLWGA